MRARAGVPVLAGREISRFPYKERPHMPGSSTTPGHSGACISAPVCVAFRNEKSVGARNIQYFATQWLACALPCRRFASPLARDDARLGAGVGRYSFTVMNLHHLLLAGLPAHSQSWGCYAALALGQAQPNGLGGNHICRPVAGDHFAGLNAPSCFRQLQQNPPLHASSPVNLDQNSLAPPTLTRCQADKLLEGHRDFVGENVAFAGAAFFERGNHRIGHLAYIYEVK